MLLWLFPFCSYICLFFFSFASFYIPVVLIPPFLIFSIVGLFFFFYFPLEYVIGSTSSVILVIYRQARQGNPRASSWATQGDLAHKRSSVHYNSRKLLLLVACWFSIAQSAGCWQKVALHYPPKRPHCRSSSLVLSLVQKNCCSRPELPGVELRSDKQLSSCCCRLLPLATMYDNVPCATL